MNLIKEEITKLSVPIGPFVYPINSSVLPEEGARETNQKKKIVWNGHEWILIRFKNSQKNTLLILLQRLVFKFILWLASRINQSLSIWKLSEGFESKKRRWLLWKSQAGFSLIRIKLISDWSNLISISDWSKEKTFWDINIEVRILMFIKIHCPRKVFKSSSLLIGGQRHLAGINLKTLISFGKD